MNPSLASALEKRGYDSLTPVQEAVTDPKLDNTDLLVSAQTGSGKTVAFGMAMAANLLGEETRFGRAAAPLALIIAPTRELALQVKRELDWLYQETGAVVVSTVGGMDMRTERRNLDRGAHIVVATPGRLKDHIMRRSMDMSGLRAVVLDEADEMLDLGFREDLEFILGEAPKDRRTLMFSATVPRMIASLAKNYQTDAVRVTTVAEKSQHADIEYRGLSVAPRDVENGIINVLRFYEAKNALVFCNTRAMVNRLTTRFSNRGFSVVALSGELSQNERSHALQSMRDGRARVCVATDVAARGIDLPNLELVIHADLPSNSETLLHRSGRTGRAGRKGVSTLIVPPKARHKAERLLKGAKVRAEWSLAPSAEDVRARDEERLMENDIWQQEISSAEQAGVDKLVAAFSPAQLAAAFLRTSAEKQSAPEELTSVDATKASKPRGTFGPGIWFSLSIGRKDRAEPRWILPSLCRAGDISKDDIGAIRIQETETYVEILATSVDGFLQAVGPKMQLEKGAVLTRLKGAPANVNAPRPKFAGKPRPASKGKPEWKSEGRPSKGKPEWKAEGRAPKGEQAAVKKKPKTYEGKKKPTSTKNKGKRRKPSEK